jgi:hypothetical protein
MNPLNVLQSNMVGVVIVHSERANPSMLLTCAPKIMRGHPRAWKLRVHSEMTSFCLRSMSSTKSMYSDTLGKNW